MGWILGFRSALVLLAALWFARASLAQQETERFDIVRFEVVGNSLLAAAEVEDAVGPFVGKAREYGDVQRALEALELKYRSLGYSAVQVHVPEQELTQGIVRIEVVEAKVGRVKIEGLEFFDLANIRASVPSLKEGTTPNVAAISANVQLANESPAKQLDVILRATDEEDVVEAEVLVNESRPQRVFVTSDTTGNNQTGLYRFGLGYQHANLLNRDNVVTASYTTSPEKPDRVAIYSLSYRLPLYSLGHSMDFIVAKSTVNSGSTPTVFGPLSIAGGGDVYGVRYNHLLQRHGEFSHRLIYGFDYKAFNTSCDAGAFTAAVCASSVPLTVRPFSVTYSGAVARTGRATDFFISYSQNWAGADNGRDRDFETSRPGPLGAGTGSGGAPSRFATVRFGGSNTSVYPSGWQWRTAASAQYTPQALVSGEQLGIAGSTSVRGFQERQVAGDKGYYANLEFYTPNQAERWGIANGNLRGLVFYDWGYAVLNAPLLGASPKKASIASIGFGVRLSVEKNLSIRFDVAGVADEGGTRSVARFRGHASLYYAF